MAETLLALLLVTSSAKGSSLVFRWPPSPCSSPRYKRAKPGYLSYPKQLDNPWRASHYMEIPDDISTTEENDDDYQWKRPTAIRDRSMSFNHSASHPAPGGGSPSQDHLRLEEPAGKDEYDDLLGYSAEFLAGLLCPQRSMCHQKFELLVDDLAFIGHPVCADGDGGWRFKPEKSRGHSRGRESRNGMVDERSPASADRLSSVDSEGSGTQSAWLQTFHLVLVLDLPDPSSSAAGNVDKYFDIIYEQIAFTLAAVLFQEQVTSNFVEAECDLLGSIKDTCLDKGDPLSAYVSKALESSSIALAMKTVFEAIKSSFVANITIHYLPMELQLPPHLDVLLHSEEDDEMEFWAPPEDDDSRGWGAEIGSGWRLPSLTPWKSILLLDEPLDANTYQNLRDPRLSENDRTLAEGLLKFLETANVTLSLADMAALLDWDLEAQVYPTVRWLVLHRRAKLVDVVHQGLKTIFSIAPKFNQPLLELTMEFAKQFPDPSIPPLPQILATISSSASKQSENHFFATVVKTKDHIDLYHDVVLWMLKRDMLITLHLRIRVVATRQIKERVRIARDQHLKDKALKRGRSRNNSFYQGQEAGSGDANELHNSIAWLSLSPKSARKYSRRKQSADSRLSRLSELIIPEDFDEDLDPDLEEEDEEEDEEDDDSKHSSEDEDITATMINDPGRATPLERRWLAAMSLGKDPHIARRFDQINPYFDGKKSDDEILYRADISRRQLREVLHYYEPYLQTFLHPS